MRCGREIEQTYTTDVTDLGTNLIIVRKVPCYKCAECGEVSYTGDVVKELNDIVNRAKENSQEVVICEYRNPVYAKDESNEMFFRVAEENGYKKV